MSSEIPRKVKRELKWTIYLPNDRIPKRASSKRGRTLAKLFGSGRVQRIPPKQQRWGHVRAPEDPFAVCKEMVDGDHVRKSFEKADWIIVGEMKELGVQAFVTLNVTPDNTLYVDAICAGTDAPKGTGKLLMNKVQALATMYGMPGVELQALEHVVGYYNHILGFLPLPIDAKPTSSVVQSEKNRKKWQDDVSEFSETLKTIDKRYVRGSFAQKTNWAKSMYVPALSKLSEYGDTEEGFRMFSPAPGRYSENPYEK